MKHVCLGTMALVLMVVNATFGQSDPARGQGGDDPQRPNLIPDPQPLFPSSHDPLFPATNDPLFPSSYDRLFGPYEPLFDRPNPFFVPPEPPPPPPPPVTVLSDLGIDSQTIADALVGVNDTADPDVVFAELEILLNELLAPAPEPFDPGEDITPRPRLFPTPARLFPSSYDPLFPASYDPLFPESYDPLFAGAYPPLFPLSYEPLFPESYDPLFGPYGSLFPLGDTSPISSDPDLPEFPDIPFDIIPDLGVLEDALAAFPNADPIEVFFALDALLSEFGLSALDLLGL